MDCQRFTKQKFLWDPLFRLSTPLPTVFWKNWLEFSLLWQDTEFHVNNSAHFAQEIQDTTLEDDVVVSFDVVSLFTRVPVDKAIDVINSKLELDEELGARTTLSREQICYLTKTCLQTTYFQFQDSFYEQVEGAAMGSPLFPVVANLYMEAFEERALSTSILRPRKWKWYVDDTFVIWQHRPEALQDFQDHLNQQEPSIQFTMEQEEEGKILFLDALVERDHNKLSTSVYRKPTHTDRYLRFTSHHHRWVLTGIVRCLKNRATKVCSKSKRPDELHHLKRVFKKNGYPR